MTDSPFSIDRDHDLRVAHDARPPRRKARFARIFSRRMSFRSSARDRSVHPSRSPRVDGNVVQFGHACVSYRQCVSGQINESGVLFTYAINDSYFRSPGAIDQGRGARPLGSNRNGHRSIVEEVSLAGNRQCRTSSRMHALSFGTAFVVCASTSAACSTDPFGRMSQRIAISPWVEWAGLDDAIIS